MLVKHFFALSPYQEGLVNDPFVEEQVEYETEPLLGGAPVLPPDPGVDEVPIGDLFPLYLMLGIYSVFFIRKRAFSKK